MAPRDEVSVPMHPTLQYRHQLRGSVLPVQAVTYNSRRRHILSADEQALRLWSTRRELAVVWLDGDAPSPMELLYHPHHDVYIVVYDDTPEDHDDACAVQILHASLAPLLRWKPHDAPVVGATLHTTSGVLITSGDEGQLRLWRIGTAPVLASDPSSGGNGEGSLVVSPIASLNEHQPRGAISVLHVSDGDDGLLLGAIDGTVWVWRLYPASRPPSRGAQKDAEDEQHTDASGADAGGAHAGASGSASAKMVAPRLLLCWEATPPKSAETQPTITCVLHLRPDRIAVGLSDGTICVWRVDLRDGRTILSGAPELCCVIAAHGEKELDADDDDDSSADSSSRSSGSENYSSSSSSESSAAASSSKSGKDAEDESQVSLPDAAEGVFALQAAIGGDVSESASVELFSCGFDGAVRHWLLGRGGEFDVGAGASMSDAAAAELGITPGAQLSVTELSEYRVADEPMPENGGLEVRSFFDRSGQSLGLVPRVARACCPC
jgi:WD40 repeat protein